MLIPIEIGWIITLIWIGLRKLRVKVWGKICWIWGICSKKRKRKTGKDPTVTETCISVYWNF